MCTWQEVWSNSSTEELKRPKEMPLARHRCDTSHIVTSLIRNSDPLGPYSRTIPRVLWWSQGGELFLMSEVPLYRTLARAHNEWRAGPGEVVGTTKTVKARFWPWLVPFFR